MNHLQIKASNPEISTWVSASAGTGKTKILTDRVLRLLLRGTNIDKILCLTFTNAAAEEMKERLANSLSKWPRLPEAELALALQNTTGEQPSKEQINKARNLYKKFLSQEQRINIQTIHSFCQKLLKKFPIEAAIPPGFRIIDEIKSASILKDIQNKLPFFDDIKLINNYLLVNFHELIIQEIINDIIQNKEKFMQSEYCLDNIYADSEEIINNLNRDNNIEFEFFWQNKLIQKLVGYNAHASEIKKFFLSQKGEKKKRIVTQKIAKKGSSTYDELEYLQHQIYLLDQKHKQIKLENHSKLLQLLAHRILHEYESYKKIQGYLDYDDLIIQTLLLLKNSDARQWVMYKLDGGIEHLLVDEAQDTSISQWQIIQTLIEEFYSGDSSESEKNRTIFVVGDEKQSIFSFQGADVDSFQHMNGVLKKNMSLGGKDFENIDLEISYRSCSEILHIVDHVFHRLKDTMPEMFKAHLAKMIPYRSQHKGSVQIWPIISKPEQEEIFWPKNTETNASDTKIILARQISDYIKKYIDNKNIIPSTEKYARPEDFMILFRKRDEFTEEVIKALQENDLPVAGLDRITLRDNIAVQDLLSIAKFILNTENDLNLASLLKSPIFGISEMDLHDICTQKNNEPKDKISIWQHIQKNQQLVQNKMIFEKLSYFMQLYQQHHLGDFFQYIVDVLEYRNILNANCGPGSNDAIDEFLYSCSNYAISENNSIQKFIFWLESNDSSIKRDNSASNNIKIMTSHASKGLQAPVVILCDTTSLPSNNERFIWDDDGNAWSANNANSKTEFYTNMQQQNKDATYAEYLRLLYVAMTRAEDHLIICGYGGSREIPENCWYNIAMQTMQKLGTAADNNYLYYGQAENINNEARGNLEFEANEKNIEYFTTKPKEEPLKIKNVNLENETIQNKSAQYGTIFHKIMEDSLLAKDIYLAKKHPLLNSLAKKEQDRFHKSITNIIANKSFIDLLKYEYITEASLGNIAQDGNPQLKRIDLLIFKTDEIIIIDYKSDKIPPKEVPENYREQLLQYKQIISKIYSNKQIKTFILWLENGNLVSMNAGEAISCDVIPSKEGIQTC